MTTITSRELQDDPARARREAENGPVFILEDGEPAYVLLSIGQHRRLTGDVDPEDYRPDR